MYLFLGITLISVAAFGYFLMQINIRSIRDDWSSNRCNPLYMPFVSAIDSSENAESNFRYCMDAFGKSVLAQMTDGLGSQMSLVTDILETLTNPMTIFSAAITAMRKMILSFATSTIGKASAPVGAMVYYLNKIQDLIRRMVGEGYIAAFFGVTAVAFIEGFVSLVLSIIKGFVYAMLIIAIILALFQPEILAVVLVLASSLAAAGA
jgi:hypothetical protein